MKIEITPEKRAKSLYIEFRQMLPSNSRHSYLNKIIAKKLVNKYCDLIIEEENILMSSDDHQFFENVKLETDKI